jgi:hypothetical protein
MGLRETFVRMLSRGSAPERDPATLRELVTVPSFQGPLLVARLADHGIEATAEDSFNLIGALSEVRILVRHADFEAAQAVSET